MLLLRHSLLVGDARALTQWLARGGKPECRAGLAFSGEPGAALGVLTAEQIAVLAAAPPLDGPALRAAQACMLALCGPDSAPDPDPRLAQVAAAHAAFRSAAFAVHELAPTTLAVTREHGAQRVLCLMNVTPQPQLVPIPWRRLLGSANVRDLLGGARLAVHGPSFQLGPWDVRWLGNGSG
jgi:hypothetical protein